MRRLGSVVFLAMLALASPASAAELDAHGSVRQVYATGLQPGTETTLTAPGGKVRTQKATALGGVLYRGVKPGDGYVVKAGADASKPVTVMSTQSAPPSTDVYDQDVAPQGYQYLTMRDGTKLSIFVRPPSNVTSVAPVDVPTLPDSSPKPTLIEYAGYGYADPDGPQSGIAILANLMGFTVVNVNMRGTGCSGGAFDFFEPLQSLDGYDIVETISRQPWVANGKVGMMGISYGGISQLFTAATQPPSLAAIAPLSVLDQVQTTLYPGGILNTGFALNWAKERAHDAMPAGEDAGQEWALKRINEGDQTCKENQTMHANALDLLAKVKRNSHYKPKVADPLSPITFVDKINVPVFMACQWTDEQTGGHCPTLAAKLTGTEHKYVTFTNGTHVDSLAPETFNRWFDFLQLYVAKQAPAVNAALYRAAAPVIYQEAMGISGVTFPADPYQQQTSYADALKAFEGQDPIRILFDNGAGADPGQPVPGFERSFTAFPVPGTVARTFAFGAKGRDRFTWNPKARKPTNFEGNTSAGENGLWTATPPYQWEQPPAGSAASYVSEPLAENATILGSGFVRAWIKTSTRNVDLQATVTEVRPDGKETFVQGGWLRANERKLDKAKSTPLAPFLSLRKRDVAPLKKKGYTKVTIPLYYQGHAYRAGSRVRVIISAPDGDQPIWAFRTSPKSTPKVTIRRKGSKLVLPEVPGVEVPTPLPACPALRGEPCRDYAG